LTRAACLPASNLLPVLGRGQEATAREAYLIGDADTSRLLGTGVVIGGAHARIHPLRLMGCIPALNAGCDLMADGSSWGRARIE
jgi:hypothetical protein